MNNFFIHHHLGLGDHFICNGLVRELSNNKDNIFLFCKNHNLQTVSQMYEDINLKIISVNSDIDVYKFIKYNTLFQIGFNNLNNIERFDQQFYKLAGIDFSKRWNSFKINRNKDRENILINELNLPKNFALVHDDNRFKIDRSKIHLPIINVKNIKQFTLIDWLAIADLSSEIHVIDSSFMFLLDSVATKASIYIHRYARKNDSWTLPTLNKNWTII